jgi:hypothetical protein
MNFYGFEILSLHEVCWPQTLPQPLKFASKKLRLQDHVACKADPCGLLGLGTIGHKDQGNALG